MDRAFRFAVVAALPGAGDDWARTARQVADWGEGAGDRFDDVELQQNLLAVGDGAQLPAWIRQRVGVTVVEQLRGR